MEPLPRGRSGSDLPDVQGGTTAEGIHLGAMAGTVDLVAALLHAASRRDADVLRLDPVIPEELGSLAFDVRYRGQLVHLAFTPEVARIRVDLAEGEPITIAVGSEEREVEPGEVVEFEVRADS